MLDFCFRAHGATQQSEGGRKLSLRAIERCALEAA